MKTKRIEPKENSKKKIKKKEKTKMTDMVNIQEILITSLKDRNIFHSEADFQHHLAWHIHTELQNPQLRL
jgi:hypothetical protein